MEHPNVGNLRTAAHHLAPLLDRVVFLGGAAATLLVTDKAAPVSRVTRDIDVAIEVSSSLAYHQLEKKLRAMGFEEVRDGPICRWTVGGILIDVMPTEEEILGFSNRWYVPAIEQAIPYKLSPDQTIRLVTSPYFLATKLDAFAGRGSGDFQASHDVEDIVSVVDGRPSLLQEVSDSDHAVRAFLGSTFRTYLNDVNFTDSLFGHLPSDDASQARVPIVLDRLKSLADL